MKKYTITKTDDSIKKVFESAAEKHNTKVIKFVFDKYIKPKSKQYLKKQNNVDKREWYITNKEFDEETLINFFNFIEKDLNDKLK